MKIMAMEKQSFNSSRKSIVSTPVILPNLSGVETLKLDYRKFSLDTKRLFSTKNFPNANLYLSNTIFLWGKHEKLLVLIFVFS